MKWAATLVFTLSVAMAHAEKILLIPLDSRPAAGQFAQMIAKMAGVEVVMPPYESLGRFTTPGNPDAILDWLADQNFDDVSAVVASADMVEFGGLIASRESQVTASVAVDRMRHFASIVREHPKTKLFVFSATMRLTPTATRQASKFRIQLAKYEEAKAKAAYTGDAEAGATAKALKPKIPTGEIAAYEATRSRNHQVQQSLLRMQSAGKFDYLVIGQDDARPFGPHVKETDDLRGMASKLHLTDRVFFCEGVDQHASVLVSRALLTEAGWTPKVRVIYSDEAGKEMYASFESKPIKDSLADQLLASGAVPAGENDEYDYTLYLNTPKRREDHFKAFLSQLQSDIDEGFPTAVADIDLANNGTADPKLYEGLWDNRRMMKLLSYAGWNTAGNTMGTSIPSANVYLLARRLQVNPLQREVAQREFLLHRFVNDFNYHKYTRPVAYRMIKDFGAPSLDEIYGSTYEAVNQFVQSDLQKRLIETYQDQFLGRSFFAGTDEYVFNGLTDIKVWLPWPRVYEVRLQFKLLARPVKH